MNSDTFIVAKAGWQPLGIALGLLLFFTVVDADLLQVLSGAAALFIAWVYRNPERVVPYFQAKSIVSVCDGTVTAIDTVDTCDLCNAPCYKVEIVSGMMETSMLRAPFNGEVKSVKYRRGTRLNLNTPLAGELNEKATVSFTGKEGERLFAEHMLELSPADMAIDASAEHRVAQGGRYGTMLKGKTTLFLPMNCRINLHVGDRVRAGETLVGYFTSKDEQ